MSGFIRAMKLHFRGYDLGLTIDPLFLGEIPAKKNREQRRAYVKAKRRKH